MVIEKRQLLYIMITFFKQTHSDQIFCRFTDRIAHKVGPKPEIPEIPQHHNTTIAQRPISKKIIEKIATSLHNVNFLSNKHILTKFFVDAQFT